MTRVLVAASGISLILIVYTFGVSYAGRVELRDAQVEGCMRVVEDRRALAGLLAADGASPRTLDALKGRFVDCAREYPAPSVMPF